MFETICKWTYGLGICPGEERGRKNYSPFTVLCNVVKKNKQCLKLLASKESFVYFPISVKNLRMHIKKVSFPKSPEGISACQICL